MLAQSPPKTSKRPLQPAQQQESIATYQKHIEGRYCRVSPHQVAMAWFLYQERHISFRQLRIYFAAFEMRERRYYTRSEKRSQKPLYQLSELRRLVGGSNSPTARRDLSADVKRLNDLGLVTMEEHKISFARSIEQIHIPDGLDAFWRLFNALPNRRRTVPVPRRTLRALAAGFGKAETAYILAALIRSVFWHKESGAYRIDGRVKGAWVSEVFQVSRRSITKARSHLIGLGWITPKKTPQWALSKWGNHDIVNVNWSPANSNEELEQDSSSQKNDEPQAVGEGSSSGESSIPTAPKYGESASPLLNSSTLSTKDLKTRILRANSLDPSGLGSREKRNCRTEVGKGAQSKPNIRDVKAEHLKKTEDLNELYAQAVKIGLASSSEAGQLEFLSLANRARIRGHKPGALLMWLLKNGKRDYITDYDEEVAARQMREQWSGEAEEETKAKRAKPKAVELTEEERTVELCIQIAKKHRIADPFRVARWQKKWTQEKWDKHKESYDFKRFHQS